MSTRSGLNPALLVAMYGSPDDWSGLSASGVGPAIACPARLALPAARTSGEAADRGNALHDFARVCSVNPDARERALSDVPEEWRHTAKGMNLSAALDGLTPVGFERAYALNVKTRTVRYIGDNIGRDYNGALKRVGQPPLSRYEIPFTVDVEAMYAGVTPVELDYKSGQSIGPVEDHWQRRVCAAGLIFCHDTASAISRVAYIKEDGTIVPDGHEFTLLDAEDFCDECVKAIDAIWEARLLLANNIMPTVHPSDEACAYCPALTSCPSWTNFAKSMLGRLQEIEKGPELSSLTLDELGKVWEDVKKAEKIIEATVKGLKLVAAETPFPVGDKYEVRQQEKTRTYFDDSKARGLIVTLLGRLEADQEEIDRELAKLQGTTHYTETRKLKKLPMAS